MSKYRRDHNSYSMEYEDIGHRNPAFIGTLDDRDAPKQSGSKRNNMVVLMGVTLFVAILATAFSIVAMTFSISGSNKAGDGLDVSNAIHNRLSVVHDRLASDSAMFQNENILVKTTHARSYYESNVPPLSDLERVSTYVQEFIYPANSEVKFEKKVFAVIPTTVDPPNPTGFDLTQINTGSSQLCTYTYSAEPTEDAFHYVTIPDDATFTIEGSNPQVSCKYNWPAEGGMNGTHTNYVILIGVKVNGETIQRKEWTGISDPSLSPPYSSNSYTAHLKYHIVNERVSFVTSNPAPAVLSSPIFMQSFMPFGRVYGYGNVDFTYTAGSSGTPIKVTYTSRDSIGSVVALPQSVFIAFCNAANSVPDNSFQSTYVGTTLTVKAEAINGIYPTNPASASMTFTTSTNDGAKVPKLIFKPLPTNKKFLLTEMAAPLSVQTSTPSNPLLRACRDDNIKVYPFGSSFGHIKVSDTISIEYSGSDISFYDSTARKANPYATYGVDINTYTITFDDVTFIPEFSTKTCKSESTCTSNLFLNFITINTEADAIIKSKRKTVVFEIAKTTDGVTTFYQVIYGAVTVTIGHVQSSGDGDASTITALASGASGGYSTSTMYTTGESSFTSNSFLSYTSGSSDGFLQTLSGTIDVSTADTYAVTIYDLDVISGTPATPAIYGVVNTPSGLQLVL